MTKYLITPSLINSYFYYINDEWKSLAESRADFLKTLSREKFEPNEAMQKGIDFENQIMNCCKDKPFQCHEIMEFYDGKDPVMEIAMIVEGGFWQQVVKKNITIGNQEFILYGKCDVIERDTIFDIKYTSNYEVGKFSDSIQHLIYLYCSDLPKFSYLISDGKDWWQEDYFNNNNVEAEICLKISDFMGYLENDIEAKEMFLNKWRSK